MADDNRALVLVAFTARGKVSGVEVAESGARGANLFHIRDGLVRRLVLYWDRDRALADLGLEEQAMPGKSMTPDLLELTQRSIEAANLRDVDALMSLWCPDAVWDDSALALGTHEGLAAIREHGEVWFGSYEEFEIVNAEMLDLGQCVVFSVSVQKCRLVGGTGYVHLGYAVVIVWVEGRIERFTTYTDIDEGRAAAERLAQERG